MSNTQDMPSHGMESRLKQLEEQARFTLDVLEMASMLGDFQTCINKLSEPSALLEEAQSRICEVVRFSATAFYLVEEASSDFCLAYCSSDSFRDDLEQEVSHLIESGVFTLAMRENRPIIVYSRDNRLRLVLHVLATTSRTRGMFVGVMPREERNLSGIMLSLLSIVLKHCANAIESFELYRLFKKSADEVHSQLDALPVGIIDINTEGIVQWFTIRAAQFAGSQLQVGSLFYEQIAKGRSALCSAVQHSLQGNTCDSVSIMLNGVPDSLSRLQVYVGQNRTGPSHALVRLVLVPV